MSNGSPLLYAYLVSVLVPPAVTAIDRFLLGRALGNLRAAVLSAVAISTIIVGTSFIYDSQLKRELMAFDIDGDGIFSEEEISAEQSQAMSRVTSDTSRTFAPVAGSVFALTYSSIFFGLLAASSGIGRRASDAA